MEKVIINDKMRKKCWDFAKEIIDEDNQYNRMLPNGINSKEKYELRIQRTYVGKLAELAFYKYLLQEGKSVDIKDMFKIKEGQTNVDEYDFETKYKETIDIKAAYKSNHKRLMVNLEQLQNVSKDYYVGIKLNAKEQGKYLIEKDSITEAVIWGYCTKEDLMKQPVISFETPAKAIFLNNLRPIKDLIKKF